jgi:hypothetical protein
MTGSFCANSVLQVVGGNGLGGESSGFAVTRQKLGTSAGILCSMGRKPKKLVCWQIRGYDNTTKIFDELIPAGQITRSNLEELLRSLAGRNLSSRELLNACAKRNTERFHDFPQIHKENDSARRRTNHYCGDNPHYAAILVAFDQPIAGAGPRAS